MRYSIIFIFLMSPFLNATAQFAGGSGTESDPYQVSTVEQLQEIQNYTNKVFVLTNDIDASSISNFIPIGNSQLPFTGKLNGQGHKILNLTISRSLSSRVGLFGEVKEGVLRNIIFENCSIYGESFVGALAGYTSSAIVDSIFVSGTIRGHTSYSAKYIGAVIGYVGHSSSGLTYRSLNSDAEVIGKQDVGGIAGYIGFSISLDKSSFTGSVKGNTNVGGIAGRIYASNIQNSYSISEIEGGSNVGGLVGYLDYAAYAFTYELSKSFSLSKIKGGSNVGGLVGYLTREAHIYQSYSNSIIETNGRGGGLVGYNDQSFLANSFSTTEFINNNNDNIGGVAGYNSGTISNTYYDIDIGGISEGIIAGINEGSTSLNTAQMIGEAATQIMTDFDFSNTWTIMNGLSYPILSWSSQINELRAKIEIDNIATNSPISVGDSLNIEIQLFNSGIYTDTTTIKVQRNQELLVSDFSQLSPNKISNIKLYYNTHLSKTF